MKIELRRYESYPQMSEETLAFTAEVWIDGAKVGSAQNNGRGEGDWIQWFDGAARERFERHLSALPRTSCLPAEESVLAQLVDAEEERLEVARKARKARRAG